MFNSITATDTREQWLTQACEWILDNILMPVIDDYPRPKIKVSVGFMHRSGSAIGQCFVRDISAQDYNEIFIRPDQSDSLRILDVLVHELIHACDNCDSGHRGFFKKTAVKAGLTGKMTATIASDELKERLNEFILSFGEIPHAKLDFTSRSPVKKQSTRMIKLECESCGFTARTSRKWIDEVYQWQSVASCPCCNEKTLEAVI